MTPLAERVAVSAGLSAFFLVVYGTAAAVASARPGVPSFYYPWERGVPFVAAAIVPYLSIDLFFVAAPLLLRTDRELRAYAWRVVAAVTVAGVCFVVMPLRFAFARPPVPGPVGSRSFICRACSGRSSVCFSGWTRRSTSCLHCTSRCS